MKRAVEFIPVITSFLVATALLTFSTPPQVKDNVMSQSLNMHPYHQTVI